MLPSASSRSQPLPEKIAARLQEARWLLFGLVAVYLAMVLLGYSKGDPGWSHAAAVERVANPGGRLGAWVSDLMLYLFGLSAWWWVFFLGLGLVSGYRRLRHPVTPTTVRCSSCVAASVSRCCPAVRSKRCGSIPRPPICRSMRGHARFRTR